MERVYHKYRIAGGSLFELQFRVSACFNLAGYLVIFKAFWITKALVIRIFIAKRLKESHCKGIWNSCNFGHHQSLTRKS